MSSGLVKENTKLKIGRRKETKIRAEIIEIETKKIIKKINKTKSCFFFKIKKKMDKTLGKLMKKRERTQKQKWKTICYN